MEGISELAAMDPATLQALADYEHSRGVTCIVVACLFGLIWIGSWLFALKVVADDIKGLLSAAGTIAGGVAAISLGHSLPLLMSPMGAALAKLLG